MRIFALLSANLFFSVLFMIYQLLRLMMLLCMEAGICLESRGALTLGVICRLGPGWRSVFHAHVPARCALVDIHVRRATTVVRGGDWLQDVVLGVWGAWGT
jgi:hypothetical protein